MCDGWDYSAGEILCETVVTMVTGVSQTVSYCHGRLAFTRQSTHKYALMQPAAHDVVIEFTEHPINFSFDDIMLINLLVRHSTCKFAVRSQSK